ncbi:O-methyltransferase [Pedobacter sp. SYP-B3415]|uniref:O-methyltransferase n=1 Tax=Pedobacter sp. SYP-B3415 TaxID=2496641 RepID=UPI00101D2CAD|nr:class I SAM-dependent methyltransferase [Pedobacter sp. SYP-B3415]
MNTQFFVDYLKHRLTAKSRHGTHSPFVYKLADEVIYDFAATQDYQTIEKQRKKLLNDDRFITVTDLGAGSHLNKNNRKQVKTIARNALKKPSLAQLLYRLSRYSQPKTLIELGTCLGITTSYFSKACPGAEITTIEGCPQTAAVAQENLNALGCGNVQLLTGNFDHIFPELVKTTPRLDFVYIDGNHRKDATIAYFETCLPKVYEGTMLVFDDIYWSAGMKEAWEQIKSHPDVTVTVDLFWIGLVFFKKGQAKEHFRLKV